MEINQALEDALSAWKASGGEVMLGEDMLLAYALSPSGVRMGQVDASTLMVSESRLAFLHQGVQAESFQALEDAIAATPLLGRVMGLWLKSGGMVWSQPPRDRGSYGCFNYPLTFSGSDPEDDVVRFVLFDKSRSVPVGVELGLADTIPGLVSLLSHENPSFRREVLQSEELSEGYVAGGPKAVLATSLVTKMADARREESRLESELKVVQCVIQGLEKALGSIF